MIWKILIAQMKYEMYNLFAEEQKVTERKTKNRWFTIGQYSLKVG